MNAGGVGLGIITAVGFLIWVVLAFWRSNFWRSDQRLGRHCSDEMEVWPVVVAVVPARNEAELIPRTLASVAGQNYPGPFSVIVADDNSTDGTAKAALNLAVGATTDPIDVVTVPPLEQGWTGKLWALAHGIDHARELSPAHSFIWLTDADIEHGPDTLKSLVAHAIADDRDLVSLMVMLNCQGFWERLLVPAFVFFFQMLYPFPAVNSGKRGVAAAAGGCILIGRKALERAGGIESIKGALIDDCTLAARVLETGGRLWLGLAEQSRSVRRYGFGDFWSMVARTAYTQLRHSPLLLAVTLLLMALIFVVPPAALMTGPLHGNLAATGLGGAAWVLMVILYAPTLHLYGRARATGILLPLVGILFAFMTLDSALRSWIGKGGAWHGRNYS